MVGEVSFGAIIPFPECVLQKSIQEETHRKQTEIKYTQYATPIRNSVEDVPTGKDAHNVCDLDNGSVYIDDVRSQWVNANILLRSGDRIE